MEISYLVGLGGNLGQREKNLEAAVSAISQDIGRVVVVSSWYEFEALIHPDNPERNSPAYLNGALILRSAATPIEVLQSLLRIELHLGRDRSTELAPWSSRVIDLDLLAGEDLVKNSPEICLPHPRMHQRLFVLEPLQEIAPQWRHPLLKMTVAELLLEIRYPS